MIAEFFEGSEIFITGGSGVVGKALIEKLLRSCNVRRIYVLLRPKKNFTLEQRLEKICNAKIFRRLHAERPNELKKLVAIPGDAVLPMLGISAEYAKILQNVSVIFHCAATVRFDEPLRVAFKLNVGGALQAIKFAETLSKLKLFMHVSTFYSNPYLSHVEPKLYPAPLDWRVCLKLLESDISDETLDCLTKKLISGFPNTYTFSKNLAENLVNDFRDRVPVVIFRPSIVMHSLTEPEPSFPPSLMGATGIIALVGAGVLKTAYIGKDVRLDYIPQDMCVKLMLYYACCGNAEYKQRQQLHSAPIYIGSSGNHAVESFERTASRSDDHWMTYAFQKSFLTPGCYYTTSRSIYMLLVFTKQLLPSLLCDLLLRLFGRQPILMPIQRKAFFSLEVMKPFMRKNYSSEITRYDDFLQCIKGTEFDMADDIWLLGTSKGIEENTVKMISTIREILLNEDPKTIPKARKILRIKMFIYNIVRAILGLYLLRWLYRVSMNTIMDYRLVN